MGSKLSLFRRIAENEEKQLSEGLNNLKVSETAQPSEPTPISEDNKSGKVEPKCQCVDCKCDPCNCVSKDIPIPKSADQIKGQDLTTVPITETSPPIEPSPQSTEEVKELIPNEDKPSEVSKPEEVSQVEVEVKVEETPRDETQVSNAEEPQKEETHQKKCLCDPCECDPCKCGKQEESSVSPKQENEIQESQPTEQSSEESEKAVTQEQELKNESPVEVEIHSKAEETVKEIVEQIDDNVETPQETNQALEVHTN